MKSSRAEVVFVQSKCDIYELFISHTITKQQYLVAKPTHTHTLSHASTHTKIELNTVNLVFITDG